MCFGGSDSGTKVQNVTTKQVTELPEYVKKGGEELFGEAKPLAAREYPTYTEPRLAGFTPDTQSSFQMVRDAAGNWKPMFEEAAGMTRTAAAPVSGSDISAFMNPYTQNVIDPMVERVNREAQTATNIRHGEMAKRGSYLNEDRRAAIDTMSSEATQRVLAEQIGQLLFGGYNQAVGAAQAGKEQQLRGANLLGSMAPQAQQLGFQGAAGMAGIGETQQGMEQAGLNLQFEDFMRQFGYPQEQINWLVSVLGGVPYSSNVTTTGQQITPVPNTFAQSLGGLGAGAGGLGLLASAFK